MAEVEREMDLNISLIGASSARSSQSLIQDLCWTPTLSGSTVSFMDVDPDQLDAILSMTGNQSMRAHYL
jgi:alpha-galactosidase